MMEYKEMTSTDLNMALLKGSTIHHEGLRIVPYTVGEITEYGYTKYMQDIKSLMLTFDDFTKGLEEQKVKILKEQNITTFDYYLGIGGEEFKNILLTGLKVIFKTNNVRVNNKRVIIETDLDSVELQVVDSNNFSTLIEIVKIINTISDNIEEFDSADSNPVDDETRELMNRMKAYRDKVRQVKQDNENENDEGLSFDTLVSAVTVMSHSINKINIWDLTLFQVNDEYRRLSAIEDYHISIKSAMTGMVKDVKIESWVKKFENPK